MSRRAHLLALTLAGTTALLARSGVASELSGTAPPLARAASSTESANRIAEAERLAAAAFDAYREQRYLLAIELYQQAWSAAPSADIAFNIARVYDRGLHDAHSASDYYRRCAAAPGVQPQRRRLAELRLAELQAELARAPLESPTLEPPASATVTAPTPGRAAATPPSPWTPARISALVAGGAGVSALAVAAGFALSAQGERARWERDCEGNACSSQQAVNAARSAGRKADIATVALLAGGGLLGVGATLWWLGPPSSEGEPRATLGFIPSGQGSELTCTVSGSF